VLEKECQGNEKSPYVAQRAACDTILAAFAPTVIRLFSCFNLLFVFAQIPRGRTYSLSVRGTGKRLYLGRDINATQTRDRMC